MNHYHSSDLKILVDRFEKSLHNESPIYLKSEEFIQLIHYYLDKNKLHLAERTSQIAISNFPYNIQLFMEFIDVLVELKEFDKAIQKINSYDLSTVETELKKAHILMLSNDLSSSLILLSKIKEKYGESNELYRQFASIYKSINDDENEVKYLVKSINYNFNKTDCNCLVLLASKFKNEIISYFENQTVLQSQSIESVYYLGLAYFYSEEFIKSISILNNVISYNEASYICALAYINLNDFENAMEMLEFAETNSCTPKDKIYQTVGECFELSDQWSDAKVFYNKSLKINPTNQRSLFGLANVLFNLNSYKEAIYYINIAINQNSSNGLYWLLLAKSEQALGCELDAEASYLKSLDFFVENQMNYIAFARFYYENDKIEKSFEILQLAIDEVPENAELLFLLAAFKIKNGNFKESLTILENALFLDSSKKNILLNEFESIEEQKAILKIIENLE